MLTINTWNGGGNDGLWTDAANWSSGVPTSTSQVSISTAGSPTITLTGSISVASLTSSDPIDVSNGSLTVTSSASSLTGGLTVAAGASLTATGSGTTLTASGTTDVDDASLYALSGASLTLSNLTSYQHTSAGVGTTTFEASGTGSAAQPARLDQCRDDRR